jgi:flagellar motor switch protein FliN
MEESIVSFFEQWSEEFARAVEMFTGERPTLAQKPPANAEIAEWEAQLDKYQWWQQETEEPQRFKAWLGAQETCFSALGEQGEGSDPKELFQEMVSQANQGAAAVLSSRFSTPLRFGALSASSLSSLSSLRFTVVSVNFKSTGLPDMVVVLEPAAAKILDGPEPDKTAAPPANTQVTVPQAAISVNATMMERLLDLELPISVLLGQTVLPIRDALKIASGSLIELDRQLGDYVEVVVHGTVVARGEIVAVKGNYGVRIKEVISRKDRFALKDAA